jgi:hypothetical protein
MSVHDVAHEGEAQSASLGVMHQRVAHSIELLEDLRMLLGGNSDSVIDDLKADATVLTVDMYREVFLCS